MTPRQRMSYNIDGKAVGDENYLLTHLKKVNPRTVGVMDNPTLAKKIRQMLPGAIVWHRTYGSGATDEGQRWKQGDKAIRDILDGYHKNFPDKDVYLYLLNEPVEKRNEDLKGLLAWLIKFMQQSKMEGVRGVIGNLGTGVYEMAQIDVGLFDDYLLAFADGWHIQGWHEYSGPFMPLSTAGRLSLDMLDKNKVQKSWPDGVHRPWWPSPYDFQHGSWHANYVIGRLMWWEKREYHLVNQGLLKAPGKKIITEFGWDDLSAYKTGVNVYDELKKRYEFVDSFGRRSWPWPFITLRGVNTYEYVWTGTPNGIDGYFDGKDGRPKWTFAQAIAEQLKWADWCYPESVIGFNLFTWARGTQWDEKYGFNYSDNKAFHTELEQWTAVLEAQTPAPQPEPTPEPTPDPQPTPEPQPVPDPELPIVCLFSLREMKLMREALVSIVKVMDAAIARSEDRVGLVQSIATKSNGQKETA